jgi:hypothetical protein
LRSGKKGVIKADSRKAGNVNDLINESYMSLLNHMIQNESEIPNAEYKEAKRVVIHPMFVEEILRFQVIKKVIVKKYSYRFQHTQFVLTSS